MLCLLHVYFHNTCSLIFHKYLNKFKGSVKKCQKEQNIFSVVLKICCTNDLELKPSANILRI